MNKNEERTGQTMEQYIRICQNKFGLGDVVIVPKEVAGEKSRRATIEHISTYHILVKYDNGFKQSVHVTQAVDMVIESKGVIDYDVRDKSLTYSELLAQWEE